MTDLAPGTYIIYSKALDANGNKLAITFEGQNVPVQVTPLTSAPAQVWTVGTWPSTNARTIVPSTRSDLQLGGGTSVIAISGTGSVWLMQLGTDGYYVIRNSLNDVTTTWGISSVDGSNITFSTDTGIAEQRWICQAA